MAQFPDKRRKYKDVDLTNEQAEQLSLDPNWRYFFPCQAAPDWACDETKECNSSCMCSLITPNYNYYRYCKAR